MAKETPLWAQAGLPGRPMIEDLKGNAGEEIRPGRVICDRAGKPIFFRDGLDAKYVADMASEFLGRDFRRVFFLSKKGDRQQQCALADATSTSTAKPEVTAIEAFIWLRTRERSKGKKRVAMSFVAK